MDSREDEQERGITMESSAVSLRFDMNRLGPDGKGESTSRTHMSCRSGVYEFTRTWEKGEDEWLRLTISHDLKASL